MKKIRFFALGGADENGKNSFVLEVEGSIFVINAGSMVPLNTSLGVDQVIPKITYLVRNQRRIKAIFITDVKNESFSALPWYVKQLWKTPIYSTPFNCRAIKNRLEKYNILPSEYELREISDFMRFGKVSVTTFAVAGSLPQQIGINFYTSLGDFTFILNCFVGRSFSETNLNLIKRKVLRDKNPKALFLDCGRANFLESAANKSKISELIKPFFTTQKHPGRILLACYDEDVFALQEAVKIAIENQRKIFIYGRSAVEYQEYLKSEGLSNFCEVISDLKDLANDRDGLVIISSTVERLYVRLRRIASNQDAILHLRPSDLFLNIAPPINGFEVYATDVMDIIAMQVHSTQEFDENTLYKMRPARGDIVQLTKALKPEFLVPIQGLYRYLLTAADTAAKTGVNRNKIPVLTNGRVLTWSESGFSVSKHILPGVGSVYIDGIAYGDVSERVLKEREALSRDGVIVISALVSEKTKELKSEIKINAAGVLAGERRVEAANICVSTILNTIKNLGPTFTHYKNIQRIRTSIRRRILRRFEKEPVVILNFYPVAE